MYDKSINLAQILCDKIKRSAEPRQLQDASDEKDDLHPRIRLRARAIDDGSHLWQAEPSSLSELNSAN